MISHEHKLIFITIPKCASTSLVSWIENWPKNYARNYGHQIAGHSSKEHSKYWDNYFKFSVVRNPYDRILSAFCFSSVEKIGVAPKVTEYVNQFDSFDKFVIETNNKLPQLSEHFKPQHRWLTINDQLCKEINVFRFEELNSLKITLSKQFNLQGEMPHMNMSHEHINKTNDYLRYYTNESLQIISRIYAKDFKMFNYKKK